MMGSSTKNFLLLLAFFGCIAGAALLQHHNVEEFHRRTFHFDDSVYFPASEYARLLAIGYDQTIADFLWLGMIQTFAAAYTVPECAPVLLKYFNAITDLAPRFVGPYNLGILGVGEEG